MNILIDNLESDGIMQLLKDHLIDMHATSPAESVHALDIKSLNNPSITFWRVEKDNTLLGCIAIKQLDCNHGEIKSMRTTNDARNQGVASHLLSHVIQVAESRKYKQLSLETGTQDFFKPARSLYEKYGFEYCQPFADYTLDPNSCFMTKKICL